MTTKPNYFLWVICASLLVSLAVGAGLVLNIWLGRLRHQRLDVIRAVAEQCDEPSEVGRLITDPASGLEHVCSHNGWVVFQAEAGASTLPLQIGQTTYGATTDPNVILFNDVIQLERGPNDKWMIYTSFVDQQTYSRLVCTPTTIEGRRQLYSCYCEADGRTFEDAFEDLERCRKGKP